jgi:hypothetical protein
MPHYNIPKLLLFKLYLYKLEKDIAKCRNELVNLKKIKETIIMAS